MDELSCPLCHQVFVEPVATECDHSFCTVCLRKWLHSRPHPAAGAPCPICRRTITLQTLRPANGLDLAVRDQRPQEYAARLADLRTEAELQRQQAGRRRAPPGSASSSSSSGLVIGGAGGHLSSAYDDSSDAELEPGDAGDAMGPGLLWDVLMWIGEALFPTLSDYGDIAANGANGASGAPAGAGAGRRGGHGARRSGASSTVASGSGGGSSAGTNRAGGGSAGTSDVGVTAGDQDLGAGGMMGGVFDVFGAIGRAGDDYESEGSQDDSGDVEDEDDEGDSDDDEEDGSEEGSEDDSSSSGSWADGAVSSSGSGEEQEGGDGGDGGASDDGFAGDSEFGGGGLSTGSSWDDLGEAQDDDDD